MSMRRARRRPARDRRPSGKAKLQHHSSQLRRNRQPLEEALIPVDKPPTNSVPWTPPRHPIEYERDPVQRALLDRIEDLEALECNCEASRADLELLHGLRWDRHEFLAARVVSGLASREESEEADDLFDDALQRHLDRGHDV